MDLVESRYSDFSERIFRRTSGETPRPVAVQFEITYRCNIHCLHCYTDPYNTPQHLRRELSYEQILAILDQLKNAGVLWLLLTGGEAILHPSFRNIYKAAKERGFVVSLFSNATVLTESIVDFLADDPPFRLEVSLHAASRVLYERIAQVPGSFDKFQGGLRRAMERGLPLIVKTKAMTVNREEIHDVRQHVEALGLEFRLYTSISPRLNNDLSSLQYRLPAADVVALEYADAPNASERCATEAEDEDVADDRLFRCGCGTNSVTISPYGYLRACTFTTNPQFNLLSMPFEKAFAELGAAIRSARYTTDSACRRCPASTHCDKNPVSATAEVGAAEPPVPYQCDVAFARKAEESRRQELV